MDTEQYLLWTTACGYLVLATAAAGYVHARDVADDYKVDNNNNK